MGALSGRRGGHKAGPETARTALYAARPPDKARQKVAPTTDSITLPPALRK